MNRQTRFLLGLAALAIALACHAVCGLDGAVRLAELREYESALGVRAFMLLEKNQDLREQITRLGTDDNYLETVVRMRLGLVGADEIIYRFEPEQSVGAAGSRATRRLGSRPGPAREPAGEPRV